MSTAGYCRYRQAIPIGGSGGRLDIDSNYGFRRSFLPQVRSYKFLRLVSSQKRRLTLHGIRVKGGTSPWSSPQLNRCWPTQSLQGQLRCFWSGRTRTSPYFWWPSLTWRPTSSTSSSWAEAWGQATPQDAALPMEALPASRGSAAIMATCSRPTPPIPTQSSTSLAILLLRTRYLLDFATVSSNSFFFFFFLILVAFGSAGVPFWDSSNPCAAGRDQHNPYK